MTGEKAENGEAADWEQRERWSGSTLLDNEDGDSVGGADADAETSLTSPSSNSSSETKLSHIYDEDAGGADDGSREGLLSRRALSDVLPYDMNLSGSTVVSEKSRLRPISLPAIRDGKKKIRRNDVETGGGMTGEKGRKPQWLVRWDAFVEKVCRRPKKRRRRPATKMKKFGFGKKSDGDDVSVKSSSSSSLFGRKKESSQDDNPYAQSSSAADPYAAPMTPYQQARAGLPSGPRAGAPNGLPSGPRGSAGPPPPYSSTASPSGGYGAEKVGASGGYGSNRYNDNASAYSTNSSMSSRGPGGYGGLGRTETDDGNRGALFGGAQDRYQPPRQGQGQNGGAYEQSGPAVAGPSSAGAGYGDDSNKAELFGGARDRYGQQPQRDYGHASSSNDESYDGYGAARELTEEEQEELDMQRIKDETKQVRNESVQTVQRSVQVGRQAQETMRGTLARLGAQGERLHNTEKNLDLASNYNRVAEDRTKELKTLNRSMFAMHVSNPFTAKERKAARDAEVLERHRMEREQREATRRDAYGQAQRMENNFKELSVGPQKRLGQHTADSNKFQFEDDDDPDVQRQEDAIREGEEELGFIVADLNRGARALGSEVDEQNKLIDRIAAKSDAVDDGVRMNREKLNRIR